MRRTLVLGAGGITGIAWEVGVLEGLRRAGVDLSRAGTVIGTSAGAVAGALLRTVGTAAAYERQLEPAEDEIPAKMSALTLLRLGAMLAIPGDLAAIWRRVGEAASNAQPAAEDDRMAVIRSRIGDPEWPEGLKITAVDVDEGEFVVFDKSAGISLVRAVAASCAIPLVWPPVKIGSSTYVDGGIRSPANADLAAEADQLVVLAPTCQAVRREHRIAKQLERTEASKRIVIAPNPAADRAMGTNPLDPRRRREAAEAGLAQGLKVAEEVSAVWE